MDFINGMFVSSDYKALTEEEMLVLEWLVKDLSDKEICKAINIPKYSLNRIKKKIFNKLDANNSRSAVYRAGLMGLI
jgi:DNA-binding NarL/FixJ family response regulator